jgi:acetyl esterase/lipase
LFVKFLSLTVTSINYYDKEIFYLYRWLMQLLIRLVDDLLKHQFFKIVMMKKIWVIIIQLIFMICSANSQTVIPLYENGIPNSIDAPDEETTTGTKVKIPFIMKVSRPTLTIFLPSKKLANGTAVVICPGGGYSGVAYLHEGNQVAEELNKIGVAAFVLKYRMPDDRTMKDESIGPLQDAQKAIMVVRQRAKEWGINPAKLGIMGFSAGGHLASTAGTHFTHAVIENPQSISLRPDFMILGYPVISFSDSIGHLGSRNNLLGKNPSAEAILFYSNEKQVTKETPPTFLVHAGDDNAVKVENSLYFYEALHKNGVYAELLVYPKGSHGFGLINPTTPDRWMQSCKHWMKSNGWL